MMRKARTHARGRIQPGLTQEQVRLLRASLFGFTPGRGAYGAGPKHPVSGARFLPLAISLRDRGYLILETLDQYRYVAFITERGRDALAQPTTQPKETP